MDLVIDANIVFSAIINMGRSLDVIASGKVRLFSPETLLKELERNKGEIRSKAGFSESEMDAFLELILPEVKLVFEEDFRQLLPEARKLLPEHPKDSPYLALALKLGCPLWSYEKRLKSQNRVKVLTTREVIELLGL